MKVAGHAITNPVELENLLEKVKNKDIAIYLITYISMRTLVPPADVLEMTIGDLLGKSYKPDNGIEYIFTSNFKKVIKEHIESKGYRYTLSVPQDKSDKLFPIDAQAKKNYAFTQQNGEKIPSHNYSTYIAKLLQSIDYDGSAADFQRTAQLDYFKGHGHLPDFIKGATSLNIHKQRLLTYFDLSEEEYTQLKNNVDDYVSIFDIIEKKDKDVANTKYVKLLNDLEIASNNTKNLLSDQYKNLSITTAEYDVIKKKLAEISSNINQFDTSLLTKGTCFVLWILKSNNTYSYRIFYGFEKFEDVLGIPLELIEKDNVYLWEFYESKHSAMNRIKLRDSFKDYKKVSEDIKSSPALCKWPDCIENPFV